MTLLPPVVYVYSTCVVVSHNAVTWRTPGICGVLRGAGVAATLLVRGGSLWAHLSTTGARRRWLATRNSPQWHPEELPSPVNRECLMNNGLDYGQESRTCLMQLTKFALVEWSSRICRWWMPFIFIDLNGPRKYHGRWHCGDVLGK